MKLYSATALLLTMVSSALLTGCTTATTTATPTPDSKTSSAAKPAATPSANATASKALTESLNLPPPPPLAQPAEVLATVEHMTQPASSDTLPHELADTTGFPEAISSLAPGAQAPKIELIDSRSQPPPRGLTADGNSTSLIERDWTGLVLVPINTSLSKAYTVAVRLLKIEAHPLRDGRVRVWIRVQNIGRKPLASEIACAFRMQGENSPVSPYFYELEVPTNAYRDVFFVSPEGKLNTYTVLVRPSRSN